MKKDSENKSGAAVKNNSEQPVLNIKYDELLSVASGIMKDGNPASIATAVIDKISLSGEQTADMQTIMQEAVIYLFHSGGCTVMQADFPKTAAFEFSRVIEILSAYSQNSSDEEYLKTHGFGVFVVPMALYGQVSIVYQDVVYFTGFDLPNMEKRLIICFNDEVTEVICTGDEIDYAEIEQSVMADAQREHDKIEQEIRQVQAELEKEQNENPYQKMIQEKYRHGIITENENIEEDAEPSENRWMRTSKD